MLKILSLPVGMDACSYYRIKKVFEGINSYTDSSAHVFNLEKDNADALPQILSKADIIFARPGSEKGIHQLKSIKDLDIKAKWVMDIDDNVDLISPDSQFYKEYGMENVQQDDKWMWKDGENGFSIQSNLSRNTYLKWAIKNADLVTVTTQKLAQHAKTLNDNVLVNQNTIDFSCWWRLNSKINPRLRVIWQGSPSHYEDWYTIKEPLAKLMDEFDFDLYMLGSAYTGIFETRHQKRVFALPWVPFEAHSYRMMSLQPDIALIPLISSDPTDEFYQERPFNQYKSSVKWYEMAAMGVPCVVSDVMPYKLDIQDGKTALAYKDTDQFYEKMKLMLTNKGLRKNISNAAYQWVYANRNLKNESIKLIESLELLAKQS